MSAGFVSLVVMVVHFIFSVVLPGIFIYQLLNKYVFVEGKFSSGVEKLILIVCVGYLYNALQFMVVIGVGLLGFSNQLLMAELKYAVDGVIWVYCVTSHRKQLAWLNWRQAKPVVCSLNMVVVTMSVLVGVFAALKYPHVLDSHQLKWTMMVIDNTVNSTASSTGAYGYSSLLYFPALLFQGIPLVALAAGLKVINSILLALSLIYLVGQFRFAFPSIVVLAYFIVVMMSHFGFYGIVVTGKDSILGVVISLACIASLIANNGTTRANIKSSIFFSAAIMSGVITLPYLLFVICLYMLMSGGGEKAFHFLSTLLSVGSLSMAVAFNAMIHLPLAVVFCGIVLMAGVTFLLGFIRILQWPPLTLESQARYIPAIIVCLSLVIAYFLMPVKVAVIPGLDVHGLPIVEYRPPLDGGTSFSELLFGFEPHLIPALVVFGVLGMVVFPWKKLSGLKHGICSFALFPLLMIVFVLVLTRVPVLPLSGFNLWDLIRDVPLWYGAITFGLFSFVFVEIVVSRLLKVEWQKLAMGVSSVLLAVAAVNANESQIFHHVTNPVHYTSIGGHKDQYFAELSESLFHWKNLEKKALIVPRYSYANRMYHSYQMYFDAPVIGILTDNRLDVKKTMRLLPFLMVANPSDIMSLQRFSFDKSLAIKEVRSFSGHHESLYYVSAALKNSLETLREFPEYFVSISNGFYDSEKHADKEFRWTRKDSTFYVDSSVKGEYIISFDVVTTDGMPGEFTVYINDREPISVMAAANNFDAPARITLSIDLEATRNSVRVVSMFPEVSFSRDSRRMSHATFFPIDFNQVDKSSSYRRVS